MMDAVERDWQMNASRSRRQTWARVPRPSFAWARSLGSSLPIPLSLVIPNRSERPVRNLLCPGRGISLAAEIVCDGDRRFISQLVVTTAPLQFAATNFPAVAGVIVTPALLVGFGDHGGNR